MELMNLTKIQRRRHGTYANPDESRRQINVCYNLLNGMVNSLERAKKVEEINVLHKSQCNRLKKCRIIKIAT